MNKIGSERAKKALKQVQKRYKMYVPLKKFRFKIDMYN